ncbi:MAG: T9SS type A sorting domain-containing protein, partial [candidate division WOR-3 bacterium]
ESPFFPLYKRGTERDSNLSTAYDFEVMIPRELYQAAHKVILPVKNPNNNGVCLAGFSIYRKPEGKSGGGPQDIGMMSLNSEKIMLNVYPNPVHKEFTITYALPYETKVNLSIYDVTGRLINALVNEVQKPGAYHKSIHSSNLAQGVYFVRLSTTGQSFVEKVICLR